MILGLEMMLYTVLYSFEVLVAYLIFFSVKVACGSNDLD